MGSSWQEHFCDLFSGSVESDMSLLSTKPSQITEHSSFKPSLLAWCQSLQMLGIGKAVGPDEIPAELIHAGGDAFGIKSYPIFEQLVINEQWPVRWKGGKIIDLFKRKGSAQDCPNSRGLLVSDHMAKAAIGNVKDHFIDKIVQEMPLTLQTTQFDQ